MRIEGRDMFKLVGIIFAIVGLVLLSVAGWVGNDRYTILKTWPTVEAEVVNSEVLRFLDSEGDTMFRAAVQFRYTVNGKEYVTPSAVGYSSSSYSSMKRKVDTYAPGTRHPVRYNPVDPGDMRFDVGYNLGFFFLPILLGGMGLVFGVLGVALLFAARAEKARQCPSCGQPMREGQTSCPSCGAVPPLE